MILVYNRLTKKELDESVEQTVQQIKEWFEKNPKRRVCNAELWYGKRVKLKPKTYETQIRETAAKTATKEES